LEAVYPRIKETEMTKRKTGPRPLHRITDAQTYSKIVELTDKAYGRPPSISEIAEALGTVKSNAYAHVNKLEDAGLIMRIEGDRNVIVVGSEWSPPEYPETFDSHGLLPRKKKSKEDKHAKIGKQGRAKQPHISTTN
jgi:DNA-binding transcriptional ArsR family regulator